MKITYFVHGTTTDNEQGIATGWHQGELSKDGIKKTKKLANQLYAADFSLVISSDLKRAMDSAIIIFGEDKKIVHDARLREINYGDWNGKPNTFKKDILSYVDTRYPGGES